MVMYPAKFEHDSVAGGFTVTFPDVPGCVTQGNDLAEAVSMAEDALKMMLGYMMRHDEAIPLPKSRRGKNFRPINLTPAISMKVELYQAFHTSGLRKSELARRMGIQKANVNRLFDLRHPSRFEQIEAAFRALRKRLVFHVQDAA